MAESNEGRTLPRAWKAPVRAVSRMLGTTPVERPRLHPDAAEADAIVDCGLYLNGERQTDRLHYADALAAAREHDNGFVWLGLKEPTAAQFAGIAQTFGLHELAVEDAVKSLQRPKVERYGEMTFMTLRTARYVEHEELTEYSQVIETGDLMMFLGPDFVITVRHGDARRLGKIRTQLDQRSDLITHGPWAVAYAVYDLVVDGFLDVVNSLEDDVQQVEEHAFARHSQGRIQRIYQLKRELMEVKRAVVPLQRPVTGLVEGRSAEVPDEIRRYFRDVHDNLGRAVEQVLYFDEALNSILQARLAQVTVDQNNDMRKIAAWAGIAAVWTAFAGVYGMNFAFMPELQWRYSYPVIMTVMLGFSITMYRGFRRSGWL
ncbi:magnesium transport protein CorA [Virgisporangium aliadipatigenens]|uniref:Magnesium transport protein CorA n=1 Tax=Virgisporangium aliadipatigenens TaxID=741659 RepID=A0A8J3YXB4_9ACTN|nr:magnesium and cobalt transport protein CorA [Virgisporangium aliadipatigenens]GIJ51510.1 magnesium transport protein CorA [Virgisporangium aliadipatigenens]